MAQNNSQTPDDLVVSSVGLSTIFWVSGPADFPSMAVFAQMTPDKQTFCRAEGSTGSGNQHSKQL